MLEVPADVATISKYLQEGFWPQWINVFSDFGVSVNYFIDGDALLVHCFEDPLLDWEHGGQPAHVRTYFAHSTLYVIYHFCQRVDCTLLLLFSSY